MAGRILAAAVFLAAAGPALAQGQSLFITPWGEPIRSEGGAPAVQAWFDAADADQDGHLTLEDFLTRAEALHAIIDRNDDGIVTSLESQMFFRATAPEIYARPPAPRPTARRPADPGRLTDPNRERRAPPPEPLRGAARFALTGEIEPVMSCDADMSRWVTREEFAACVTRRFRLLDADNDGRFALSESPRSAVLLGEAEDEER